ncbi:hypothetical protein T4E_1146 [Trichinella pseudospiralis]|uniref:Uncharacterized protein n=1 Tax=Trichinella pseudospiralis TaxID=6337 RepID=A0A0V0Y6K4_TRIPS|nr:hypothetical protein T4E_1146 [Trichinella pseudospiralis]
MNAVGLKFAQWQINASIHETTGQSSSKVAFGEEPAPLALILRPCFPEHTLRVRVRTHLGGCCLLHVQIQSLLINVSLSFTFPGQSAAKIL